MDQEKQKKNAEKTAISPLANEKTYGERMYSRIFDWGLNYWTNLLASAGFSQWAEHATRPIKIPFLMKEAASPRQIQANLATWIQNNDPFMKRLHKTALGEQILEKGENITAEALALAKEAALKTVSERSMARARSLTLLMPGFAVMIPAVWLGAKVKPAIVEWFNRRHYGAEAMEDPSLKARHQAIEAEDRPTFLGTLVARAGTVLAVQATAQLVGSDKNILKVRGIDPVTESIGTAIGSAAPQSIKDRYNALANNMGLRASEKQIQSQGKKITDAYTTAVEDLCRFIAADTIYTAISAFTVRPFLKLLQHVPFMTFKPKVAQHSASFEGDRVKIASHPLRDSEENAPEHRKSMGDTPQLNTAPSAKVSSVHAHEAMATHAPQPQFT